MKRTTTLLALLLPCLALFSQTDPRIATVKTPLTEVERAIMPALDNKALLEAELKRRAPGVAPKFAESLPVDFSATTHGTWETMPDGKAVWRLRIYSKGARSLNLGFSKYHMPPGGSLILYSTDYQQVMGPFTPADNEEHGQLWTPVLPADEVVVEVQLPAALIPALQLQLSYVNHDFAGFYELLSGSCNLDVVCGAADGWAIVDAYRDIIQSVAAISTGGSTFCTGFLVNNARQDCTPYFMTAYHCGIDGATAPSLVTYWNYQNSICRQPNSPASGAPGNGQLGNFNTGSYFRAGYAPSDFTLVELDDPVSPTANAFFAGWSAENFAPTDTVITIHHPQGEEKRISFEFQPTFISDYFGNPNPNGNHLLVPDWDIGTTESGSSGSPLFNREKRVVGQLHGGLAACGNNDEDYYGWFHTSWEGGGSPANRLNDWLDPDNTGIITLDGRSHLQCSFFVQATPAFQQICIPQTATFSVFVSPNFNHDVTLSLSGLPAGLSAVFENNPLPPGSTTTLTIDNTGTLSAGTYTFVLEGSDGTDMNTFSLALLAVDQTPAPVGLSAPTNGSSNSGLTPTLSWNANPGESFTLQVASDENFNDLTIAETGLTQASFTSATLLTASSTYYWRVKASNICGEGDWSDTWSFSTGNITCLQQAAAGLPIAVGPTAATAATSILSVTLPGFIQDVNVQKLSITHSYVGDVRIELTSPAGTTVTLMANPGSGGCEGANLLLDFDDAAANTYDILDNTCNFPPPAISGIFQPLEPLSAFQGEWVTGDWKLTVFDDADGDGGTLDNWQLDFCALLPDDASLVPLVYAAETCLDGVTPFPLFLGLGFDHAAGVTLSADNLPAGASAVFSQNPATPGATVIMTLSEAIEPGSYVITITATDATNTAQAEVLWTVNGPPASLPLFSPANLAAGVSTSPVMTWHELPDAVYTLEIATDIAFTNPLVSISGLTSGSFQPTMPLDMLVQYFWRVRATTVCGTGDWSEVFSFSTGITYCDAFASTDVPKPVGPNANTVAISKLNVTTPGLVDDLEVINIDIAHTWVSDLRIELVSPAGTTATLMMNPFCDLSDVFLSFDDQAANTYSDLNSTCHFPAPAISGVFQPLQPLSLFKGEPATGNWTLRVYDDANDDGGSLKGWGISLCNVAPNDFTITPNVQSLESCIHEVQVFSVLIGSAFEASAGVSLSAGNLPPGVSATFYPNPALPGAQVEVTLSGAASAGFYTINLLASDGTNSGDTFLWWNVKGPPPAPAPVSPTQNAMHVSTSPTLTWLPISGATYHVQLATNAAMNDPLFSVNTANTAYTVFNLDPCTKYYWQVFAEDECGLSEASEGFSFTTQADLTFLPGQQNVSLCSSGSAQNTLTLGVCFSDLGVSLSGSNLPAGVSLTFNPNPALPGTTVNIGITTDNAAPGGYPLTITGNDGANMASTTFVLVVTGAPPAPALSTPANGAVSVPLPPVFSWNAVPLATNYVLELATDPTFSNIVLSQPLTQTTFTPPLVLFQFNTTYYWRVTANGNCGSTASAMFSFTTEMETATHEIKGARLNIFPNPTSGLVSLTLSHPLSEVLDLSVWSVQGVLLQKQALPIGSLAASFDLSAYPAGMYLVKIATPESTWAARIFLKK